jgi:hypothetical protein
MGCSITLIVPKSAVGSPAPDDLLGAVNGRTFTGDTPQTQNLERSTLLVDHTFVKGQRDNGHPAATYTVGRQRGLRTVIGKAVSYRLSHGPTLSTWRRRKDERPPAVGSRVCPDAGLISPRLFNWIVVCLLIIR